MAQEGYSIMERLIDIRQTELNPTLRALSDAGATTDDADWIRKPGNAEQIVEHIHKLRGLQAKNPFEQSVEEQIAALRQQNELGTWGISDEAIARLAETAPAWPAGKDAHRSFRLRFEEGSDGVATTFEAHAAAVERVHGSDKFWRWELLYSKPTPVNGKGKPVERLRILNGNDTHHAVVEWIIIPDLSAFRQRQDVTSVRGLKSMADEGLVLAWLNPKRAQAIDHDVWPAWFCAGYEANVPEFDGEEWQFVVIVNRNLDTGKVKLNANWRSNDNSNYSVPPLGSSYQSKEHRLALFV